ncbi:uncharacterized protein LOC142495720 [Ascaphus truei]|uniref:uncharacterized protein LOC142495720 n=1 Tax=Ascaphus truei TaxID=8439 RepID=UPI003F59150D
MVYSQAPNAPPQEFLPPDILPPPPPPCVMLQVPPYTPNTPVPLYPSLDPTMLAALSHYAAGTHHKPPAPLRRGESKDFCPQSPQPTYVELRNTTESEVVHLSEPVPNMSSFKGSPNRQLPTAVSPTRVSSPVSPPVSRYSEEEDSSSESSSHSDMPSPPCQLPLRKLKETTASAASVTSESSAEASNERVKEFCASVRVLTEEFKEFKYVLTDSFAVILTPAHNTKPVLATPQSSFLTPTNTTTKRKDAIRTAKKREYEALLADTLADSIKLSEEIRRYNSPRQDPPISTRTRQALLMREQADTQDCAEAEVDLALPFMTLGKDILIHSVDTTLMESWATGCPDPFKNPSGAIKYLKKRSQGYQFTGGDIRFCLDCLTGHIDIDWSKADKYLSKKYDAPGKGSSFSLLSSEAELAEGEFVWNDPRVVSKMWDLLQQYFFDQGRSSKNVGLIMTIKQKEDESVTDFCHRFKNEWVNTAGMQYPKATDDEMNILYVQSLLNGLCEQHRQIVYVTVTGWQTMTPEKIVGDLAIKDGAGAFPDCTPLPPPPPPPATIMHAHDGSVQNVQGNNYRSRGGQNRGRGRGQQGNYQRKPGVCFNCGKPGHWRNECWAPSQGNNPQQNQQQDYQSQGNNRQHQGYGQQSHAEYQQNSSRHQQQNTQRQHQNHNYQGQNVSSPQYNVAWNQEMPYSQ